MRIGQSIWHSKRIDEDNAEIAEFEKPIEIKTRAKYLTCMPMSSRGGMQVLQYGENVTKYWSVVANPRYFNGKIKEGDLMWVDGEKPITEVEEKYGYGTSANAIVTSVAIGNDAINIVLETNNDRATK
jgi:hypothetical protein